VIQQKAVALHHPKQSPPVCHHHPQPALNGLLSKLTKRAEQLLWFIN